MQETHRRPTNDELVAGLKALVEPRTATIGIRTISLTRPSGLEQQTDFRGNDKPQGILIALGDGRIITIANDLTAGDMIVVHGPDMETLLSVPLPPVDEHPGHIRGQGCPLEAGGDCDCAIFQYQSDSR